MQRQAVDATTTFIYAQLLVDGTHKQEAAARDLLLPLIEAQPSLLQNPQNESFIRFIVARCRNVGPIEKAAAFGSQLAQLTQQGADYFDLSEMLSMAPAIRIVITVSPVPLMTSFEFESCVQADCISKSTMRLVAHEVVQNAGLQSIYYWRWFEVFRWAGSNASDYIGADDGSSVHVSEDKVSQTIKAFIDTFSAA